VGCVSRVYTDHGVFAVGPEGLGLLDGYGNSLAQLQALLPVPLRAV